MKVLSHASYATNLRPIVVTFFVKLGCATGTLASHGSSTPSNPPRRIRPMKKGAFIGMTS